MDWISWISFLVTLMHFPVYIASKVLDFDIWEGNVTALWDPPEGAPIHAVYQVQQAPYFGHNSSKWDIVPECNMTTETRCELGNLLFKPEMKIKVELQGNGNFSWSAVRRIRLYLSKLLAPEFDLSSTANMVKVKIHRKPFLQELFNNGPSYSAILYPKGQESQAITVSDDDDEDGEVEFTSLPLWQEYCVHVKVEMISSDVSNTSLPRCIYPSADMSMVIYMAVIGVVGVMTFFIFVVCFFLRRPGKMPAVLKSAVNGWHPMHVGLIQVETVTDKGWVVNTMAEKSKAFYEDEELSEDDKERRESTDSGVSVGQQNSLKNRGTDGHTGDEDSGCGSLTGTDDSGLSGGRRRSLEELPFLDGGVNSSNSKRKDDSGLGMVNKDDSDNLQGADGDLSEIVVGGDGYRSQSPSADAESKATVPYDVDTKMASPSSGYRSGHVTCSCSDFETCIWCKTRKLLTDSGSLSHEKLSTTDNDNDRPSYLKKSPVQTVNALGLGDLSSQSDENSSELSLFITCPLLLQEPCQLDTLPLTLGDIELTFT
ncbi:interleukin-10 receptor subunit alpha [Rhinichthys klamathensis goyatoka]|uniref:interleukin-10 receptor subunit alpha n=1 Tax=Rhinichthys klamathensis goyatoka TaxID=3034132 RepID=UPI0024B57EF3|nr:interleukin-10 receptor subunit alpha [Rhinichthys klamathensis goyatoka]